MPNPLRILFAEDSENDMLLEVRALKKGGFEVDCKRVQTADDFERALKETPWDLVIMDYSMPKFSTPEALDILRRLGLDCPAIVVSGTVGEDIAVETMRIGAHDYILKDNLKRLVPAVQRELAEHKLRREQRKMEVELQNIRARFSNVVNSLRDIVFVLGTDLRIIEVFGDCKSSLGFGEKLLLGKSWDEAVQAEGEDAKVHREMAKRALAGNHIEYDWTHQVGEELRYMQTALSPVRGVEPGITGAVGIVRDITENRRSEEQQKVLQEQLRQSQKMEAIGQLAGGVAHDFNNLMTVVVGYGELLLGKLRQEDPHRANIDAMVKAGRKASSLTRQLLAFSRKQPMAPKVVDLNTLATDSYKMLRRLIEELVHIEVVPSSEPNLVCVDPGSLDQVLMNLAVNARDAMPDGGRLIIETSRIKLDDSLAKLHLDLQPGPYAQLTISDTGTGMNAETLRHIFEPFYTTKPVGKGTGLGLATVYGVVKQCGGGISVTSELGKGTTFKIYLPAWEKGEVDAEPEVPAAAVSSGGETILIVEDGDEIRQLSALLLSEGGYRVLTAADPKEALKICSKPGVKVDLLLTDVIMPEMSGRDLVVRLKELGLNVKVLYMSGYTDNVIAPHGVLNPGTAFLEKPFTSSTLLDKVREALTGKSNGGSQS